MNVGRIAPDSCDFAQGREVLLSSTAGTPVTVAIPGSQCRHDGALDRQPTLYVGLAVACDHWASPKGSAPRRLFVPRQPTLAAPVRPAR